MRKSIFTLILFASIQILTFAQQELTTMTLDENIENISQIIAEKNDITGTFAVNDRWQIFVDDAKVDLVGDSVVEIADSDLNDLLRAGYVFVQEDKAVDACYRYRIVSEEGSPHKMYLFDCNF